jgi:hypothetical protein
MPKLVIFGDGRHSFCGFGENSLWVSGTVQNSRYLDFSYDNPVEDQIVSFSNTAQAWFDVVSLGAHSRMIGQCQPSLFQTLTMFIGSVNIVLSDISVNVSKVNLAGFGEANATSLFCPALAALRCP